MHASMSTRTLLRRARLTTLVRTQAFSRTRYLEVVKPFLLADIGEGIRECEIIQWFVEPEARVEEFDKICEVQSDKASVDVTSRFAGVIKRLHYEAGQMAIVGKPLIDIDVPADVADDPALSETAAAGEAKVEPTISNSVAAKDVAAKDVETEGEGTTIDKNAAPSPRGSHSSLATPAVRHLSKELKININEVEGSGRDGRVTKEDLQKFQHARVVPQSNNSSSTISPASGMSPASAADQQEITNPLSQVQAQMFKTMTRSLTIPHFCYCDEFDLSHLKSLRTRLNSDRSRQLSPSKISYLPFIIKAMSMAIHQYPILNCRLQIANDKPSLVSRSQHNIGIAIDTPSGLLVPVIRNVAALSIAQIASEISRLQALAQESKLTAAHLSGGTITLSNIGSIGGTYLAPVIVDTQVAICAVGKLRDIPAFGGDGEVIRKSVMNFSWSADHRVVDGATVARASEIVRGLLERPDEMVLNLR